MYLLVKTNAPPFTQVLIYISCGFQQVAQPLYTHAGARQGHAHPIIPHLQRLHQGWQQCGEYISIWYISLT